MKHYKSINKIYYDLIIKEEMDERPLFLMQHENGYLVFRDVNNIYKKCLSRKSADIYIKEAFDNPQVGVSIDI